MLSSLISCNNLRNGALTEIFFLKNWEFHGIYSWDALWSVLFSIPMTVNTLWPIKHNKKSFFLVLNFLQYVEIKLAEVKLVLVNITHINLAQKSVW